MMTIIEYLENNEFLHGKKKSIIEVCNTFIYHTKCLTWSEFNTNANKLSNWLIDHRITWRSKVAILMQNDINWLPIYFGILKAGAIAVPLNYNLDVLELQYCIELSECSVIIYSSEFARKIKTILSALSCSFLCIEVGGHTLQFSIPYTTILKSFSSWNPVNSIVAEEYATMYFSSGTTGVPKAVLLTHKALLANAQTEQKHHHQSNNDNFLIAAPLYHTGAMVHWLGNLVTGGAAVILNNVSPCHAIEIIAKESITIAWLLLPQVQDILDAIDMGDLKLENYDLKSWRLTHMGAQPIPPDVIQRWMYTFPSQQLDVSYGLSEAGGPGCVHLGIDNCHKLGSIGQAGYGWDVMIVSDEGEPVPDNTIGEIIVKGDGVMVEYYKNPEETMKVLKNGWLFTGDMAYKDDDGFIYLVGRKKDIIISGGENIYPIQIENYLKSNLAVRDAAVIGVPNRRLGEISVAFIEVNSGYKCTASEIHSYCKNLPLYKRPFKIIFSEIPRNAAGKVQKQKLKEQYMLGLKNNESEI